LIRCASAMTGISKGGMETHPGGGRRPARRRRGAIIGVQSFKWGLENNAFSARALSLNDAVPNPPTRRRCACSMTGGARPGRQVRRPRRAAAGGAAPADDHRRHDGSTQRHGRRSGGDGSDHPRLRPRRRPPTTSSCSPPTWDTTASIRRSTRPRVNWLDQWLGKSAPPPNSARTDAQPPIISSSRASAVSRDASDGPNEKRTCERKRDAAGCGACPG